MKRVIYMAVVAIAIFAGCKKKVDAPSPSTVAPSPSEDTLGQSTMLYGVSQTTEGGSSVVSKIFKIKGDGTGFENLFTFETANGIQAYGALCKVNDRFYGMMSGGGAYNGGTIYSFTPASKSFKKIFDFNPAINGFVTANSNMILAADGNIYGVNFGYIFKIDPNNDNVEVVFNQYTTGIHLGTYSSLIEGSDHHLYVTSYGDPTGNPFSAIVKFVPAAKSVEVVHTFQESSGINPLSPPINASDNNLYGLTAIGGSAGKGALYKFNPISKTYTKLVDFGGEKGEASAVGRERLIEYNGKLFGVTHWGGVSTQGVFFSLDLSQSLFKVEKLFDGEKDKFFSPTAIMMTKRNIIYLCGGGYNSAGAILRYNPVENTYKTIYSFSKDNSKYMASYSELVEF